MEFRLQEKIDSRNKLVNFRATESEIKFIKEEYMVKLCNRNKRGGKNLYEVICHWKWI